MTTTDSLASALRILARSGTTSLRLPRDEQAFLDGGMSASETRSALRSLINLGHIRKVANGVYAVQDIRGVERTSLEELAASRIAGHPHLATGWWVLAHHRLTTMDVKVMVVLCESARRPLNDAGRTVRFAPVVAQSIWGGTTSACGLIIATPSRAIIDCVGTQAARIPVTRTAEAIDSYLGKRDTQPAVTKLVRDVARLGSASAARRLGYMVELLAGPDAAAPFLPHIGISRTPIDLEPGDSRGIVDRTWRVRTALTREALLDHREAR